MFTVSFTEQELGALRQLLHRACLHGGLEVAQAAATLDAKLRAAKKIEQPAVPSPEA